MQKEQKVHSCRPAKLALTGAHGTGKTTLSRALADALVKSNVRSVHLPEIPRVICQLANDPTFFRRGKNSALKQALLLFAHTVHELEVEYGDSQLIICDRSLIDHWAYTLQAFQGEFETGEVRGLFSSMVARHCKSYDLLFYVPIEFPVVDDGTREADPGFQREVDEIILGLLREFEIQFHTLSGDVASRVDQVMCRIKELALDLIPKEKSCNLAP